MNKTELRPTRRDPDGRLTAEALGCLAAARNLRLTRVSWVVEAYAKHGERGPLTSGVEQEHWPEPLKDRLRLNAREIAQAVNDAYACWARAGRRRYTLQQLANGYRVDGSRY